MPSLEFFQLTSFTVPSRQPSVRGFRSVSRRGEAPAVTNQTSLGERVLWVR